MSANYYSQTPNFISASSEDVDPRTRLFSFQHSLGQLIGNNAMGPELNFAISYSPTSSTDDFGLGIGIFLPLTIVDTVNQQLSLASGESYKVDFTMNPPVIKQNKMQTFTLVQMVNDYGTTFYRLTEHDGSVTDLNTYEYGKYIPTRMYTALGYSINIKWKNTSTAYVIDNITDDSGVTLLKCNYDSSPILTFYPGSSEEYSLTLHKTNSYLSAISHSGLNGGSWQYFYQDIGIGGDLQTLVKTQSITGLIKEVVYNNDNNITKGIMLFPTQSGQQPLPAVTRLTVSPGFGQPDMVTDYGPNDSQGFPNYLGFDSPEGGQWDATTDYVYSLAGQDYFYSTTLTQTDSDGQKITTTYTYNNYHLLSKLEVLQGDTSYIVNTSYYADAWQADHPDTRYDDLPAQYQYPQTQTLTWKDSSGTRSELTQYQYDDFGNLTQQIDPDGTQTDYEFYSADGEADSADGYTGCPADPNGFANRVKSKKVTPAPSDYDDVPIRETYHHYGTLDALADRPMATAIVKDKESLVKVVDNGTDSPNKQPLTTLDTKYYSDDETSFEYGHVQSKITTVFSTDSKGTNSYPAVQAHVYSLNNNVIKSEMTLTSWDNISLTSVMSRSLYSGKITALTDFLGNPHTYYYDGAGRFSYMVTHEGNAEYERKFSVDYSEATLSTCFIDYNNSVSRLNYDALGRVISIEKSASENINEEFSTVLSRSYDSLGRILYETITDSYLDDQDTVQSAVVNIKTQFDLWGRPCAHNFISDVNNPSASIYITRDVQFDSVGNKYKKYLQSAAGQKASNYTVSINNMNLPETVTVYDKNDSIYSTTSSSYDGLKRLRHVVDQMGHTTDYEYDDFDRVYRTTYVPETIDMVVVEQEYAPQFSIAVTKKITVIDKDKTPYEMGSREIDGLGRVLNSTVGGRYEVYEYNNNTPAPHTFTDSINRIFTYGYDPLLENALTSITADYNGQSTEQTYSYFKKCGLLDTATEKGQQENSYTWFTSRQVKVETIANNLGTKMPGYTWSVINKPVSYTDISDSTQWISYYLSGKDAGKPFTISDDAVIVTFTYDEFGRLYTQKAEARDSSASLETTISYDDYGREQTRVLTPNSGEVITINTQYYENNQISNFTIMQGQTKLSDNQYYYDARNRLQQHDCSGSILPKDGYGVEFMSQVFEYDCLNNIKTCTTVSSGGTDKAIFKYINSDEQSAVYINDKDPVQLTSITHSGNPAYPQVINLAYYADGRLKSDEAGRMLTYDASGRLFNIEAGDTSQASYGYDGFHNLVFQSIGSKEQYLYYRGSQLVNQVRQSEQQQDRIICGLAGNAAVSHEQL